MGAISRRAFLARAGAGSAAAAFVAAHRVELQAYPLTLAIGSQVYPHRALLRDFPAFCRLMSDIGVSRLELCSPLGYRGDFLALSNARQTRRIMIDHGLKCESVHVTLAELRTQQMESIAWAKEVGATQMLVASLGEGNGFGAPTLEQIKRAADEYNRIAAVAASEDLQQGLHNEVFEHSIVDGVRTYDRLFDLLDPKLVKFQFQMSAITAGLNGAQYFLKYPGRFISMHVQDVGMAAQPLGARGSVSRPQRALGQGSIDWVSTFRCARIGGIKNYYVEQNLELTKASVSFLKALKV